MSDDIIFGKSSKDSVDISKNDGNEKIDDNVSVYSEGACRYKQEMVNRISKHDFNLSKYIDELISNLEIENNSKYDENIKEELRRRVESYVGFWWDLNFERISGDIVRSYLRDYSKVYRNSIGEEPKNIKDE